MSFQANYIDRAYGGNGKPGWVQAADMDGDGDQDIVAGGGEALFVYENLGGGNSWRRHGNLDSTNLMGANAGVLFDVDGDGDVDVISAKYAREIGWWENPGGALRTTGWTFHRAHPGFPAWYLHDMVLLDLDKDGKKEEIVVNLHLTSYWDAPVRIYWLKIAPGPGDWVVHTIQPQRPGPNHCHAGFGVGDINRDGNVDLSYSNGWYEGPANPTGTWTWHPIVNNIYGVSNSQTADVDGNGQPDLVVSAGHHGAGVYWLEPLNLAAGTWTTHTIDASITHPEGLQVFDLDGDGDQDVVACELFFGINGQPNWTDEKHNLYLYENLGGSPPQWRKINLAPDTFPSHLPYLVDINADGKLDLISEATGAPIVTYFENTTSPPSTGLRLDQINPNSFVLMRHDSVRIQGAGMNSVTGVRMGSFPVRSTDPEDWVRGYFRIVSDNEIEFFPPHVLAARSYAVSLESPTGPTGTKPFYLYRATDPLVRTRLEVAAGGDQHVLVHGLGQQVLSYLVVSLSNTPITIPGVATISIGGGQPLTMFGPLVHNATTGVFDFGPAPTLAVMQGIDAYFQAAVWDSAAPVLPLRMTNVWKTSYK